MARQAHNPAAHWRTCTHCNTRLYFSRKDAKAARTPELKRNGLNAYPCPHTEGGYHLRRGPRTMPTQAESRRSASTHTAQTRNLQMNHSNVVVLFSDSVDNPELAGPVYAERVQSEIEKMMAGRATAAIEEYELRCLPAGSRFKIGAVDIDGRAVDPRFVGRTGTVLPSPPMPVTGRDGDLREVIHSVRYDGDTTTSTLSDLCMTVVASASASASAIR